MDVSKMGTDQVIDLTELVSPASAALGDVLVHDPGGSSECLVRSGELVIRRTAASDVRNRLRRWIEAESDVAGFVRVSLRASEAARCVEIAADVGATPNHVHFACPIMIGTSRPMIGKRLPPGSPVPGSLAVLDTPLAGLHGSLVDEVLAQHGVNARHTPVLTPDGFGTDLTLAAGLLDVSADVVLVASGTYTFDDRCPPVLSAALEGRPVVAAAGNGGSERPWWPAAAPSVVAVGALDGNFSGAGSWVDAWESGVDVPSAMALCTGTSFAAAVHAARTLTAPRSR